MKDPLILAYAEDGALAMLTDDDLRVLTHVNLAFGVIRNGVVSLQDLPHLESIRPLRERHPDVKWVLSIGGWTADGFCQAAWDEHTRGVFAASVAKAVDAWQLDGVDIDWEFPCNDVGGIAAHPNDKQNYTLLLAELRRAIGNERILSVAVSAEAWFITNTEMDKVAALVDYVQIMTYDMRPGVKTTGHHTAPYAHPGAPCDNSVAQAVERYHAAGVPLEKIIIGAAFYGRHWIGLNAGNGLYQETDTYAEFGPAYSEICRLARREEWQERWDEQAQAPYLVSANQLISYDNPRSIKVKCRYLKEKKLKGIMYWEHHLDDTHTLLKAMAEALRS